MSPFVQQIQAWSYSRLNDYKKCPRLAKFKHVLRMKEPGNQAMDRGTEVHGQAEGFTTGKIEKLPEVLYQFKTQFVELKASNPVCEQEWAFTKDWTPTGWFDRDCWVRIKVDAHCEDDGTLYIIDHKTGKVNEDHEEQRKLYGLGGLVMYPKAKLVIAQHWYIDHGAVRESRYTREQQNELIEYWVKESKPMLTDTRFAPNPGNHCRWCHFRKANGGPCEY